MNNLKFTLACCIFLALLGCEQKTQTQHGPEGSTSQASLDEFIRATKANLVFVKGGNS